MVGQAGHETGWGQREIKMRGGKSANNLFGIKADPSWKGKVAEVTTTEYVKGVAEKRVAKFRAYESADESFRDYAPVSYTHRDVYKRQMCHPWATPNRSRVAC